MRIYVASSWRNQLQPGVVAALRESGHEVYDFRNPPHGRGGFAWSQIDPDWMNWSPAQWRDALRHPLAQDGYRSDLDGMQWAEACVLVLPCGRSAHLEAGWFAGRGRPVAFLALDRVEPDLMVLLGSAVLTTGGELLEWAGKIAREIQGAEGGTPAASRVCHRCGNPVCGNDFECPHCHCVTHGGVAIDPALERDRAQTEPTAEVITEQNDNLPMTWSPASFPSQGEGGVSR